jgi:F-type H+-transporting ATPase subunit delta
MAELATIARPYAEAAFGVAIAEGSGSPASRLTEWSTALNELAQVASNPEVLSLTLDPKIGRAQLTDLLISAVRTPLSEPVRNFVTMLVENHRTASLPQIAEQFEEQKNAFEGAADAVITSAFPLEGAALADLVSALEKKFGCKLKAHVVVDPSLIGGVSVAVGDEVLDTSVRARLAQMQAALTA